MHKSAILSDDRLYRYALRRTWDDNKPACMFIGLNPSTADETDDDPTIRRCINFAKSWGFGGLIMVNLFAWRSTAPVGLLNTNDPIGPDNDKFIKSESSNCGLIVAAWGNGKFIDRVDKSRPGYIKSLFLNQLCVLHSNNDGTPGHPLYLKSDLLPKLWT